MPNRRKFMTSTAAGVAASCQLGGLTLPNLSAAETQLDPKVVRFDDSIEGLVRLIEETERNKLIETVASRVQDGLDYRQLLAALFLAGVRNVQPRPSVGFKFHAVLVVNSAHLASISSGDGERWLPIFWALDNFKSAQARDVREGNWTMAPVDESKVPTADVAQSRFIEAMDQWDVEKTDTAVAGLSRVTGANQIFELFARFGARDFRSIGHKAIYVANSYRTLNCIGWHHSEPILRSLAYALLNHEGQPNPADSDLSADRPWRKNLERAEKIRNHWLAGKLDPQATTRLLETYRTGSPDDVCDQMVEMLNAGVAPQSLYDATFLAAGELLMRQPGIVSLHAVTSTNALHYAFKTVVNDNTRKMLLLQNGAFLPLFRSEMDHRGNVGNNWISDLEADASPDSAGSIFQQFSGGNQNAASGVLSYLEKGGNPKELIDEARRYIFLKGSDSHDYKFSSAVLEDFYHVSPQWRNRFLASSVFKLRGAKAKDNGLVQRVASALA